MKQFRFFLFFIVFILILLSLGCKASTPAGGNNIEPMQKDVYYDVLQQKQKEELLRATPQDLIQRYYGAINGKQYDYALACLNIEFIGNKKEDMVSFWKKHYKSIQVEKVILPDGYNDRQSDVRAFYQVSYTFEKNADDTSQSAEISGINVVYVNVEKKSNSNRWMITALGTSP